jgi:hypothetical protein
MMIVDARISKNVCDGANIDNMRWKAAGHVSKIEREKEHRRDRAKHGVTNEFMPRVNVIVFCSLLSRTTNELNLSQSFNVNGR